MAQIVIEAGPGGGGGFLEGCKDPFALNYNPDPTVTPCVGCCVYSVGSTTYGCTDPLAVNYNPNAQPCVDSFGKVNGCCQYTITTVDFTPVFTEVLAFTPKGSLSSNVKGDCVGPYSITIDNIVKGVENAGCCSETNKSLGQPPQGYQYYWDGKTCRLTLNCPTTTTCIDCTNFSWWNNTYIANHDGQSLSVTSPILWQQVVDLVTNSGQTISVNTLNGELISEECCEGVFKNGICFCQDVPQEDYEPRCIANLTDFLNFISTDVGYDFFTANFLTIGPSLGLTPTQVNFILLNINSNVAQDSTQARLILSNALNATGGFHINFGVITNTPILMTKGVCDQYGGYWDGTNCMCKPIVDQCEIDLSQVQVINSYDFFNNPIRIVVKRGGGTNYSQLIPLDEACCNRLINDNPNMGWVWQSPYCLASPKEDCLPAVFELNTELMEVPPCGNDLELTMWVYFDKPKSPCQPIPDPPDDDIITIDGQFCDITLTPNTGAIINNTANQVNVENINNILNNKSISQDVMLAQADVDRKRADASTNTPKKCCYNIENPILARITTTDPSLNLSLTQVKNYDSSADYFEKWVQIKATLPTSGLTLNFGVNLEIYQGLNCCCDYDFFVDDIQVNCIGQVPSLIYNDIQCPGFNLTKVIDNKKSWVYNPGIPDVGISDYDIIERADGSFGMLNGEGRVNRTFAPSLDASIPWRYTDYWKQSSVYENHSNLVLNTKELWLTFDMCADCPITGTTLACPDGFTLSANTQVCYKEEPEVGQKIFQNGDEFIFMNGDNYIFQFQ